MTAPTGVGPGGKREGAGRPFGSTNHKARQIIIDAERNGDLTPLDYLLATLRDATLPHRERLQAAAIAAPFCHPKLTAQVVGYLDPNKMSDEELLRSIAHLERLNVQAEAEHVPPFNPAPGAVIRPPTGDQPAPAPEPSGQRRLRYDAVTKRMVQAVG